MCIRDSDVVVENPVSLDSCSKSDRKILKPIIVDVDDALFDKTLFGSPSGWLIATICVVPSVVVSIARSKHGRATVAQATGRRIREDIAMNSSNAPRDPIAFAQHA